MPYNCRNTQLGGLEHELRKKRSRAASTALQLEIRQQPSPSTAAKKHFLKASHFELNFKVCQLFSIIVFFTLHEEGH